MEAFYQESGRAGRDQLPSRSVLYYGMDDSKKMVGLHYLRYIFIFSYFLWLFLEFRYTFVYCSILF